MRAFRTIHAVATALLSMALAVDPAFGSGAQTKSESLASPEPVVAVGIANGCAFARGTIVTIALGFERRPLVRSVRLPFRIRAMVWSTTQNALFVASGQNLYQIRPSGSMSRVLGLKSAIVDLSFDPRRPTRLYLLAPDGRPAVQCFDVSSRRSVKIRQTLSAARKPWRISLGDVDGDGESDMFVGVVGRARFHQTLANRPFVYSVVGGTLAPKWLGSRLSRPFVDARLIDLDSDGTAELVAIETTRNGERAICAYRWESFGFARIATTEPLGRDLCFSGLDPTRILAVGGGNAYVIRMVESTLAVVARYAGPIEAIVAVGGNVYSRYSGGIRVERLIRMDHSDVSTR